jgi:hypothetical protein
MELGKMNKENNQLSFSKKFEMQAKVFRGTGFSKFGYLKIQKNCM